MQERAVGGGGGGGEGGWRVLGRETWLLCGVFADTTLQTVLSQGPAQGGVESGGSL
jgi:hypothetical protein